MSFLKKTDGEKRTFHPFGSFKTRAFRVGGYSVAATAIVIAIAVVVNVLVSKLPTSITQPDITSDQLYSLSEQTEQIMTALEEEVTIYWVVQSGYENSTIGYMLNRYDELSDKITVTKLDPDVYPTMVQQYTSGYSVSNNSLIVVCGSNSRYITNSEIFVTEIDYSSYYTTGTLSYSTTWAGESELTSAINILTSGETTVIYALTGHGESEMDSTYSTALEKENASVETISLLTEEAVPEDADCILIYAPQTDLSEEETAMILEWLQTGGNLIVVTMPLTDDATLPNLEELMAYYGMVVNEGIVIEGNSQYYAYSYPYYLLPAENSHDITDPLISSGYYVLLPIAQGLNVADELRDGLTVTELLTTSDSAFSKIAGYNLTTYEKEDGDIDGPFALAIAAEETNEDGSETKVLWVSSPYILDSSTSTMVSGGNEDFFLNAVSWMAGETDSISIRTKSITTTYLTIPSGTASMLSFFFLFVIPVAYLAIGVISKFRRKRQ